MYVSFVNLISNDFNYLNSSSRASARQPGDPAERTLAAPPAPASLGAPSPRGAAGPCCPLAAGAGGPRPAPHLAARGRSRNAGLSVVARGRRRAPGEGGSRNPRVAPELGRCSRRPARLPGLLVSSPARPAGAREWCRCGRLVRTQRAGLCALQGATEPSEPRPEVTTEDRGTEAVPGGAGTKKGGMAPGVYPSERQRLRNPFPGGSSF